MNLIVSIENIKNILGRISGCLVTISYNDDNFLYSHNYEIFEYVIDDCYLHFSEKNKENNSTIKLLIHKIKKIESVDEDIIKINFTDGREVLFVSEK